MLFAEEEYSSTLDQIQQGVLYTMFQYVTNYEFNIYNSWTWGYNPNTLYEGKPNTLWYLPSPDEVQSLYSIIGFNAKALFKGEVSGFDAKFNGYYGYCDIQNNYNFFNGTKQALRYKGELNVISSRTSKDMSEACIMVLDKNYKLRMLDDNSSNTLNRYRWRDNFYPVRPTRGFMYEYPLYSTIKKNLK
jgi:hypothetical protein